MKCSKTLTTSFVLGILLISSLFVMVPTTQAKILNITSLVRVQWATGATSEPVVPRGTPLGLDLNVSYTVTRGALGKLALAIYQGRQINVNLEIISAPSWCTVGLSTLSMAFTIPAEAGVITSFPTKLTLTVSDQAPAYGLGNIVIKATAVPAGLIGGYSAEYTLTFTPGYKPLISVTLPKTNTLSIGPMDTATFPIQIQNLGNARTYVNLNVSNVPSGWTAVVTSQVILDNGTGSTATAYLVVKPPKNIGYHYDENTITVALTPARADDQTQKGATTFEQFLIQSRGFSTPGFDPIIFIAALAIVLGIVMMKRKKNKNK